MILILHYLKDPKLWELWYIPYYGKCRIYIINRIAYELPDRWGSQSDTFLGALPGYAYSNAYL